MKKTILGLTFLMSLSVVASDSLVCRLNNTTTGELVVMENKDYDQVTKRKLVVNDIEFIAELNQYDNELLDFRISFGPKSPTRNGVRQTVEIQNGSAYGPVFRYENVSYEMLCSLK